MSSFGEQDFFRYKMTQNSDKDLDSQILILSSSKAGECEKVENIILKSCSQILEEMRKIDNLVRTNKKCRRAEPSYYR